VVESCFGSLAQLRPDKYEGPLSTIADAQLELEQPGGKLEIAKGDTAQGYYIRYKPLSDSEKYSAQEENPEKTQILAQFSNSPWTPGGFTDFWARMQAM